MVLRFKLKPICLMEYFFVDESDVFSERSSTARSHVATYFALSGRQNLSSFVTPSVELPSLPAACEHSPTPKSHPE
ncbi:unnamed protein product [Clavelina lepadiformis]|uniref:Uncharacterized protein n=1 Tax=Clavelina lepadiformis TaxID=159417 RepID=A0ABP0FXE7_CLALP